MTALSAVGIQITFTRPRCPGRMGRLSFNHPLARILHVLGDGARGLDDNQLTADSASRSFRNRSPLSRFLTMSKRSSPRKASPAKSTRRVQPSSPATRCVALLAALAHTSQRHCPPACLAVR